MEVHILRRLPNAVKAKLWREAAFRLAQSASDGPGAAVRRGKRWILRAILKSLAAMRFSFNGDEDSEIVELESW